MDRPGAASLALGSLAVAAGVLFLSDVGALPGMASRNVASFIFGLVLGWVLHKVAHLKHGAAALFTFGCLVLVLVLVAGTELDGVRRWVPLGPLRLQPALILAPMLLAIAASREGRHWRAAILVPLLLVGLQPDSATMIALAAGVAAMTASASSHSRRGWTRRRTVIVAGAIGLVAVGLVFAGIRTPPPVAFVEGTVGIAALSGWRAMMLHLAALVLMVAALLVRASETGTALAGYFAAASLAAMFWAFPMPVVGAGPSHLVGFGLAIGWLVERRARAAIPSVEGA